MAHTWRIFLLSKKYTVVGMVRRSSTVTFERIQHIQDDINIIQGDLHDQSSLVDVMEQYQPEEVYNLAAQSFVPTSWNQPVLTGEVTALGVTASWRQSALPTPRDASTRPRPARCSARCARCHRARLPPSTRAAHTAWQKYTGTGSPSTTASLITCTRSQASCSTTRARAGGRNLSPARSPMALPNQAGAVERAAAGQPGSAA